MDIQDILNCQILSEDAVGRFLETLHVFEDAFREAMNRISESFQKIIGIMDDIFFVAQSTHDKSGKRYLLAKKISSYTSMKAKKADRKYKPMYLARSSC